MNTFTTHRTHRRKDVARYVSTILALLLPLFAFAIGRQYNSPNSLDRNIHFDGTAGNYASRVEAAGFGYTNDTLTIEAWVHVENMTTYRVIFCNTQGANIVGSPKNLQFRVATDGKLEFGMNTGTWQSVKSTRSITGTGKWVHVAVVKNGTGTSNVTLYINGEADATGTVSQTFTPDRIMLGAFWQNSATSLYFNGNIDELRIWKKARTADEIKTQMYNDLNGNEAGLAAYYRINEDYEALTIPDNTGKGYGFTLTGSAWQRQVFPRGAGTEADPYLIETLRDLQLLSHNTNAGTGKYYFKQTADIDAAPTRNWHYDKGYWSNSYAIEGFVPITQDFNDGYHNYFNGTYDGQNHRISNLYVNAKGMEPYLGGAALFSCVKNAVIKNLGLTDCYILGSTNVAGLVSRT